MEKGLLTYDVVWLLHHCWLRRIHNVPVTNRDCVLASSNSNPRAKDIVPGKAGQPIMIVFRFQDQRWCGCLNIKQKIWFHWMRKSIVDYLKWIYVWWPKMASRSFNMNEKINFYGYDIKFVKMALDNFQDFFFFFLRKKENWKLQWYCAFIRYNLKLWKIDEFHFSTISKF